MSLGCGSPNVLNGNLVNYKVPHCTITDGTCAIFESGCSWAWGCNDISDQQREEQCRNLYPSVPGIKAFPDIQQVRCGFQTSGKFRSTQKTTCYDSVDHDVKNCCITGNPRFLPSILTDTVGLQLSSCDPNLSPANFGSGMCDSAFIGGCPYNQSDLMKRIDNFNKTGSYKTGGSGKVNGFDDTSDRCGTWMDALSRSSSKTSSDVIKKMVAKNCTKASLASETGETNTKRGICREWCRQNPGYCDVAAQDYCTEHINAKCGTASGSESCVKYEIDPFCTCIYWSNHGMKQPQCFSSECQGGRGLPGYKTGSMSSVGNECGQYCQQQIRIMGKDITTGDISQTCNMVQSLLSESSGSSDNSGSGTTSHTGSSPDTESTNWTIIIVVMVFIFFVIIIIIIAVLMRRKKKHKRRY